MMKQRRLRRGIKTNSRSSDWPLEHNAAVKRPAICVVVMQQLYFYEGLYSLSERCSDLRKSHEAVPGGRFMAKCSSFHLTAKRLSDFLGESKHTEFYFYTHCSAFLTACLFS